MTTIQEKRGDGFHLISEANGFRSREQVTILQGEVLEPGTILGKITASGKYVRVDNVTPAVDGSEQAAAILLGKVDATNADVEAAVHIRDAELNKNELIYANGAGAPEIDATDLELEALELILRT